jgi:glycosyltransferase A (GT-A) superfamily protein (DUF2064 family)
MAYTGSWRGPGYPRCATIIFARAPEDEQRAKPLISSSAAGTLVDTTELHRKLLERALEAAAGVLDANVLLVTTGDLESAREAALRQVPAPRLVVLPQTGSTFRERFETAVRQAFDDGYEHVVVVGSDTPELNTGILQQAYFQLDARFWKAARAGAAPLPRAVLGPALDGGYYLLGLSSFSRSPFVDIDFGGPEVTVDTSTALEQEGFAVSMLAVLPDIDDVVDAGIVVRRLQAWGRARDASLLALLLSILATATGVLPWLLVPRIHSLIELLPRDCRGPPLA